VSVKLWYEKFGFSDNPFKLSTDGKFLVGLEDVKKEVIQRIMSEDIILIIGSTGTGKTTFLRWLENNKKLNSGNIKPVFLGLLENRKTREDMYNHLKRGILDSLFKKKYVVLLDEANDIRKEYSEALKEMVEKPNTHIKSIVMTNIDDELNNLTDSFKKRISAKIRVKLSKEELIEMIKKRVNYYGKNPFNDDALEEIIVRSGMNPRDILKNCEKVLLNAKKIDNISADDVRKVLRNNSLAEIPIQKDEKERIKEKNELEPIERQKESVLAPSIGNLTDFQKEIIEILGTRERSLGEIVEIYNQRSGKQTSKGNIAKQLSVLSLSSDIERMRRKGVTSPIVIKKKTGKDVTYSLAENVKTLFVKE